MAKKTSKRDYTEPARPDGMGLREVYIGPSIMGLTERQFIGRERSEDLNRQIAECPALGRLIVPMADFAERTRKARLPQSQVSRDRAAVRDHFRRG